MYLHKNAAKIITKALSHCFHDHVFHEWVITWTELLFYRGRGSAMLHFHVSTVAQSGQTNTGSIEDLSVLPGFFLASSTGEITYHQKLFYCMLSSVTLRKLSKAWQKEPRWCHQGHPSLHPGAESMRYKLWHSKDVRSNHIKKQINMTCRLLCGKLTIQCIWSWSHSRVEESRYLCIGCFNLDNSVCHMFCPSYFGDYATELPTKSRSLPLFWTKSLGQGHLAIWFTLEQLSCNLSHNLASQAQCMLWWITLQWAQTISIG